ncbi:hypothetical protein ACFP2T_18480 [Plantactinospora solaniradicis]|uniref:Uncharacterized protein n=1 Tax=Plantactinospora solaniradicis TaxID=1723736 RepID=A0ABW1KBL9_9ACTN
MEDQLSALAGMVSEAIIQAMVTDGWEESRPRITRALHRTGRADQLGDLMDADREAMRRGEITAGTAGGRWRGRLESIIERHPHLEAELKELIADLQATTTQRPTAGPMTMTNTRGGAIQAGGSVIRSGNRTSYGGILIVIAVAVVLLIVGAGTVNNLVLPALRNDASAISPDTLCREYLQAPQGEREQAVQRIAVEQKVSGAGSPFLVLNVDSQCGSSLDVSLGTIVARQQY